MDGEAFLGILLVSAVGLAVCVILINLIRHYERRQRLESERLRRGSELHEEVQTIVHAYGAFVEKSSLFEPESTLPYSKEVIRNALVLAFVLTPRHQNDVREHLRTGYMLLESFLPPAEWEIMEEWTRFTAEIRSLPLPPLGARIEEFREMGAKAIAQRLATAYRPAGGRGGHGSDKTVDRTLEEIKMRCLRRIEEFDELTRKMESTPNRAP